MREARLRMFGTALALTLVALLVGGAAHESVPGESDKEPLVATPAKKGPTNPPVAGRAPEVGGGGTRTRTKVGEVPGESPLSEESQAVYETKVRPFLARHCYECHSDKKRTANFDLESLGTDFLGDHTGDSWQEVYDNISKGLMPKEKKLSAGEVQEANLVTDWISQERRNAEQRAKKGGLVQTRRMNRFEYLNCLRDLFDIDHDVMRTYTSDFQEDVAFAGFDRIGAGLYIDDGLWETYYDESGKLLDKHLFPPEPKLVRVKAYARDVKFDKDNNLDDILFEYRHGGGSGIGVSHPVFGGAGYPALLPKPDENTKIKFKTGASWFLPKNGGIEYLAGGEHPDGIGKEIGMSIGRHDRGANPARSRWGDQVLAILDNVQEPGTYRLTIRAGAFPGRGKHAVAEVRLSYVRGRAENPERWTTVIDAPLDKPKDYQLTVFLRPMPRRGNYIRNDLFWNGIGHEAGPSYVVAKGVTRIHPELGGQIEAVSRDLMGLRKAMNEAVKKGADRKEATDEYASRQEELAEKWGQFCRAFSADKKEYLVYNPEYDLNEIPRLWVESLEIEGPIVDWPPRGRTRLFFDGIGDDRVLDESYIREIFARFLLRAYRRPPRRAEVDAVVSWVQKQREAILRKEPDEGHATLAAVKEGIKLVLCSPDFLLLAEPNASANPSGLLDDYELASRLSFFLWSSMPDDDLFRLAAENKLHEPGVLRAQVRRMLQDSRSLEFVRNFVGQWLQVRKFDTTITDRHIYKNYSSALAGSSRQEPFEFFKHILQADKSILNFVDSNFLVIDETLAKHYGIEGESFNANNFKEVPILPEHHRGGILGMAGVLTYLSDGLRTQPVRRGAYVLDTLWNEPPKPPPPDAGALPKLTGKETVRERLAKHKADPMCAACHVRIDPFGMALENYDAIGAWREQQNGELYQEDRSPAIDASGVLPDRNVTEAEWRKFDNLEEYKKLLMDEKHKFVQGFTEKMLTYALGRRAARSTDRDLIAGIVRELEEGNYRMQTLIQAVVASDAFRKK